MQKAESLVFEIRPDANARFFLLDFNEDIGVFEWFQLEFSLVYYNIPLRLNWLMVQKCFKMFVETHSKDFQNAVNALFPDTLSPIAHNLKICLRRVRYT